MKKFIGLMLLPLAVFISSCGSDDGGDTIEGKWEITTYNTTNCDNDEDNFSLDLTESNCIEEDGVTFCAEIEYEFKSDGTMVSKFMFTAGGISDTETDEYSYSYEGNSVTICDGPSDCSTSTYTVNENSLSLSFVDEDNCSVSVTAKRI